MPVARTLPIVGPVNLILAPPLICFGLITPMGRCSTGLTAVQYAKLDTVRPASNLDVLKDQSRPVSTLVEIEQPSPIQALAAEELLLTNAWRRLDRNRAYQPLLHRGWRQPAAPFGEALPIRIHGGAIVVQAPESLPFFPFTTEYHADDEHQSVEELDGSIAFERGRFLHLRIDLALRVPVGEQSIAEQSTTPWLDDSMAGSSNEPYRPTAWSKDVKSNSGHSIILITGALA